MTRDHESPAASGRQIELAAGELRVTVVEVGGGIRTFTDAGAAVLDGYKSDEMATFAQGQTLIPWPNRLADGTYDFAGRKHELPLTEPGKGNAIHGLVRWANWQVTQLKRSSARLSLMLHPQAGYPFTLALETDYTLDSTGLTVCTKARNAGSEMAPYGVGFHPYITVGTDAIDAAKLQVPATTRLELDERGIPTGRRVAVDGSEYDFRKLRTIGSTQLDTAFTDLVRDSDGRARVRLQAPNGERAVTVWLDEEHRYVMAFSGDDLPDPARRRRSLGVEPMTCPPNAFQTGEDVRRLHPGEEFSSAWGITVGER